MNTDERIDALAKRLDELTGIVLENEERAAARAAVAEERHDREMADLRATLRQAVLLGIREARQERGKRRELEEKIAQIAAAQTAADEKISQLAAAQLVTEEKLQRFLESRRNNGNQMNP
jgi:hypothetical protein